MIVITSIIVEGIANSGAFRGALSLLPGLNVLSADNAYGKSLAMTAIPWCLGLEPMFGLQNNDTSRFPVAARDMVSLGGAAEAEVTSSVARLGLLREDGAMPAIRGRSFTGAPPRRRSSVALESPGGEPPRRCR